MKTLTKTLIACAMAIAMTVNAQTSQETDFPPTEEMNIADSILLEVTYDVTVKYGKPKEATRNDVMTLEIGNSVWHSWLKGERKADYARMKSLYTSGRRGLGFFTFPYTYIGEVFGNFPQGQATVIKNLDAAGVYQYREDLVQMDWNISSETKKVLEYECSKATCQFRGRNYTAWFTPEIPLKVGPYKFTGLPGLILEISSDDGEYKFTATGLEKPHNHKDILYWKREYVNMERNKVEQRESMLVKDPFSFLADYGFKMRFADGGGVGKWSGCFNPIEK